jgi:hypothetical protein
MSPSPSVATGKFRQKSEFRHNAESCHNTEFRHNAAFRHNAEGIAVTSTDNPQLMLYGLGALTMHDAAFTIKTVKMSVFQPRVFSHPQTMVMPAVKLLDWAEHTLHGALSRSTRGYHLPPYQLRKAAVQSAAVARCFMLCSYFVFGSQEVLLGFTKLCDAISAMTEFMVRVLHSSRSIGIQEVV